MKNWGLPFRYLMGILLLIALIAFVAYAHEALEPLVIAAFIAYLVNPAVVLLSKSTRISRRAAVNFVYFSAILFLVALPASFAPLFLNEFQGVWDDLQTLLRQLQENLAAPLSIGTIQLDLSAIALNLGQLQTVLLTPLPEDAFILLESTSRGTVWLLVIIVCVYLFLSEWHLMRDWLFDLAPQEYRAEVVQLYGQLRGVWMAYLRGQIVLMLVVGVVFTIAWAILGIPGALVLGVIAGLFTLVPDIGPIMAVVLAMAVALLEGSSWITLPNHLVMLIVFGVYLVLINLKNMWLRPFIMGRSLHMNEGFIFIAILVATVLNGIMGALLVVPVMASALVIVQYLTNRILGRKPYAANTPPLFRRKPTKRNRN